MTNNALGRWAAFAIFCIGVLYIVALIVGIVTRGVSAPIVDPLLAVMEFLTLVAAPFMLAMMAAIHGRAPEKRKTVSAIGLAFMVLATGLTSAVHFVALTATRQLGSASLVWPSTAYALELLAWDVFLGLSLLFASFSFEDSGRERKVKRGLLICGILCVLGVLGPAVGNMRLQLIGVFGYAVVLPVVCLYVSKLFRGDASVMARAA